MSHPVGVCHPYGAVEETGPFLVAWESAASVKQDRLCDNMDVSEDIT